ncbi:MAG: DUF962 domain-containing protein [Labilithrix sp.]
MSLYDVVTFEEFWPRYLRLHARRETQLAHAAGTLSAIVLALVALASRQPLLLLAAPLVDFAIAQLSHRLFEGNATTPWAHPLWHARAELRMFRLVCMGRIPH